MEKDITQKRVWSTKDVLSIIAFVIMCTFYVTVVYKQIQAIDERLDKKIKIINSNVEEIQKLKNNK